LQLQHRAVPRAAFAIATVHGSHTTNTCTNKSILVQDVANIRSTRYASGRKNTEQSRVAT
jgi:hypothetical protein